MRPYGLMSLALLTACSDEANQSNAVDVSAAARRAETDIADYAAQRRLPARKHDTADQKRAAMTTPPSAGAPRVIMPATVAGRRDATPRTVAK
jgi:hypothetical protein